MTSKDLPSATSSQEVVSGPLPPKQQVGQKTGSSGPAPVLANLFQSQANKKEMMIQGTYGRTFLDSSAKSVQPTLWESKLVARLATHGSTESAMILRKKTTPAGRQILRLVPSTRLINAPDSTGMVTWPTTMDAIPRKGNRPSRAATGRKAHWSTPLVRDHKDTAGMATQRKDGKSRLDRPSMQAIAQARAIGEANGLSATTVKQGAPNPIFAFWLMGFSEEWTIGALQAMQSYRSSQNK